MSSVEEIPELGTIRLFDRVTPPLNQGHYKVVMKQNLPTDLGISNDELQKGRFFEITGPRWRLNPAGVHSMTPPDKEQNAIASSYVPMVVLGRRTLPWERSLFLDDYDGTVLTNQLGEIGMSPEVLSVTAGTIMSQKKEYPSMALLLFTEDELTYRKGQTDEYVGIFKADKGLQLVGTTDNHEVSNRDEKGVFHNAPNEYKTKMGIDSPEMESMVVDAVKVPKETLANVCPTISEIRLLSHARQVNPMDKEQCGSDEDGWFAVSVSNRVPSKPNTKYHACLVSLEGRLRDGFIPLVTPTLNERGDAPPTMIKERKINVDKILKKKKYPGDDKKTRKKSKTINPKEKSRKKGKRWFKFSPRKMMNLMSILIGGMQVSLKDDMEYDSSSLDELTEQVSVMPNIDQAIGGASLGAWSIANQSGATTRLVLLHHWTFTTGAGGDYEARMKSLKLRIVEPGDSNWSEGELVEKADLLKYNYTCSDCGHYHDYDNKRSTSRPNNCFNCSSPMPSLAHAEPMLLGNAEVPDMTGNSYLATDMVHSDGGTTQTLYRGPLVALPVVHDPKTEPYWNSDQALGLVPGLGMDDISQASAYEIGRLLALTDESFMKTAARWRRTLYLGEKVTQNYGILTAQANTFPGASFAKTTNPSMLQIPSLMSLTQVAAKCLPNFTPNPSPIEVKIPSGVNPDPSPIDTTNQAHQLSQQIASNFSMDTYDEIGDYDGLKDSYESYDSSYAGGVPE